MDEIALLRALASEPDSTAPSARAAALQALEARFNPSPAAPVPARRLGSSRRRLLAIGVPITALALLVSVIGIPSDAPSPPTTLPALARVAAAAAAQPAPGPRMPYLYQKTQSKYLDSASWSEKLAWSFFVSETDETWVATDGTGRQRRVVAPVKFAGPEDREAWEAASRPSFQPHAWSGYTEELKLRPQGFRGRIYKEEVSDLPTDPAEISDWLIEQVRKSHNGFSPAVRSLSLVSELLNDPYVTPELRAALYEAEGRVPGIEDFGRVKDAIGRPGIAIGAESANSGALTRYALIFDPKTSQVLATEQTMLKPPAAFPYEKTPVLSEAKLFIESAGVSSLTVEPSRH